MNKKKIIFINPRPKNYGLAQISILKWPHYGLAHLASLTPLDFEVEIINENFTRRNPIQPTNLVALTATTASVYRAYEIADTYRKRGVTVIMGGVHASALPQEALEHVDSVIVGEADLIWPEILNDFLCGKLQKIYQPRIPENLDIRPLRKVKKIVSAVIPRVSPVRVACFQACRGCPNDCEFCAVTSFNGRKVRRKSVPFLLEEIEEQRREGLNFAVFVDDNIVADKEYARELFKGLKDLKIRWASQADVKIADDDILDLACASGLRGVFLGLESISSSTLKNSVGLVKNHWRPQYERAIEKLRQRHILVGGGFIFGFDNEDENTISDTLAWSLDNKLDFGQFSILTPLPGTKTFERLDKEGRIVTKDWNLYDLLHCVHAPMGVNPRKLEDDLKNAYRTFYSPLQIFKRRNKTSSIKGKITYFVCNVQFRMAKEIRK